jgi:hypothetical protein
MQVPMRRRSRPENYVEIVTNDLYDAPSIRRAKQQQQNNYNKNQFHRKSLFDGNDFK